MVEVIHPSMAVLSALSQIGLVLDMFLVGLEFNADYLRTKLAQGALLICGGRHRGAFPPRRRPSGSLPSPIAATSSPTTSPRSRRSSIVGASMSITAFPMLARILFERGIAGTRLGTVTLAARLDDDAVAWCCWRWCWRRRAP